jgi:hypothetical protein
MAMDDNDWLDQRLASSSYISDDGFTARIVIQASAERKQSLKSRRVILAVTGVLAVILTLWQSLNLARSIQQLQPGKSIGGLIAEAGKLVPNFTICAGAAAFLTVCALVFASLARRWS